MPGNTGTKVIRTGRLERQIIVWHNRITSLNSSIAEHEETNRRMIEKGLPAGVWDELIAFKKGQINAIEICIADLELVII